MKSTSSGLPAFRQYVGVKFQLYNGLFTALPFHHIENTGVLLSTFSWFCEQGFADGKSPESIIEDFFERLVPEKSEAEKLDLLFRFIQFAERQVVLFDAIEDAAFEQVQDVNGAGSLNQFIDTAVAVGKKNVLKEKLNDFSVQLVLTAHPTQFYPGPVLGIINDVAQAIEKNDSNKIQTYLQQLGQTPFLKKQKPTPYHEAMSLVWYLENVFYNAAGRLVAKLQNKLGVQNNAVIRMGFWPGGDRDGNPFVTADTTLQVAETLRSTILKCYYLDVRTIRRRLTFRDVEEPLAAVEKSLYQNVFDAAHNSDFDIEKFALVLTEIKKLLREKHNSIFINLVNNLLAKLSVFGKHFATLDIRQESSIHADVLAAIDRKENIFTENYLQADEDTKQALLAQISTTISPENYDGLTADTIRTIQAIKNIQHRNGEAGCDRYIISQCKSATHVLEVMALFSLSGWNPEQLTVDIVPLFETIADLENSAGIMRQLFANPNYSAHIQRRGMRQVIMLGFSDGTKDGGYLMANWSIYKAKESLSALGKELGIKVVFFDGRGGPPSRGGGKSHRFYAAHGNNIPNHEIQVTIQGQTVSSSFGTTASAKFNMEQLVSAGLHNKIFNKEKPTLEAQEEELISEMAQWGFEKYRSLIKRPEFMDYLSEASPLKYYSDTNIASRPTKRGSGKLTLADLRAIPYVGAWSQIKQNVTGFYGVGTALKKMDEEGKLNQIKKLHHDSLFFRTLLDNCEMSMTKSYFPLTTYLKNHPEFGKIWIDIFEEFELTKRYLLAIGGHQELMEAYPVEKLSIEMRERIVLPLATIQQFALQKINSKNVDVEKPALEKLIIRTSFGIINAARNSV